VSAVELRGFGWRHAGRKAWAVRGVDLRVERGERVLLLGPSGAGKSTLLAALAGLLADDSGEREGTVEIDGLDTRKARERVGIVFQDPESQLVMSRAGDDVAFGLENRGVPRAEIWPRVVAALRAVGFDHPVDRSTAALSGGEKQRLALAGALALRPDLLLLDEPTANLDPVGASLVRSSLRAVPPDTTVIMVEHRLEPVMPFVDRVVVLAPGGGVVASGSPGSVFGRLGPSLAADGIWVPGQPLPPPRRAPALAGDELLTADQLALSPRLAPISARVRAGEALAVVGPNGIGKSTLALLLGGLLRPSSGQVVASSLLAGRDAARPPHAWRAAALASRIGSVFQDPEHQFVASTVYDELAVGPRRLGLPLPVVDSLLSRLRLDHLARANPYTLSGGEARRLSVATALAAAPRVLVLDEPTFGQDRRTWIELVDLLASLRDEGHGLVTVTHDLEFADALADRRMAL